MKMSFTERLKLAMTTPKRVTGKALAEACGIKPPSVSAWLSGDTKAIEAGNLLSAAKFLNVSPEWLQTGRGAMRKISAADEPSNVSPRQSRASVPLISSVRAGNWGEINDHIPDTPERVEAWHSSPSSYAFALTVTGDSMTASAGQSFPHGCTLIVDPERSPKAGDYVVAKDVDTQEATFKRLMSDGGRWYLKPLNTAYPMIQIDDVAQRVIGVVIEWQIGGKL